MKIKGFDKDLKCRGFQFEIGKTYDTGAKDDELRLCSDTVFHYCDTLKNVHNYYSVRPNDKNRFCEIEVLGNGITDGEKFGSNKIKIVREIVGDELDILRGTVNGNVGIFNTGNYNTGYYNTGNCNTGDRNTGDNNTGNYNTGYYNTGNCNTGDRNTGDNNTGNCNTGDRNTGDNNTGHFNSCNNSTGLFCTIEPKAKIFDIDTNMTMTEIRGTDWYRMLFKYPLILTEWKRYTEEEKKQDKEKEVTGGYLKEYTYKEACQIWWNNYTEEEKKTIMSMPNFDKDKFKQITGIMLDF